MPGSGGSEGRVGGKEKKREGRVAYIVYDTVL